MDSGAMRAFGSGVEVDAAAFVHPTAQIYGDVRVAAEHRLWASEAFAAASRVERARLEVSETGGGLQLPSPHLLVIARLVRATHDHCLRERE